MRLILRMTKQAMKAVAKTASRAVMVFLTAARVFLRKTKKPKTPPNTIATIIMMDRYLSGNTDKYSKIPQTINEATI